MNIKELVDRIVEDGKLTKTEHEDFLRKVNEDNKIDPEESDQIKRLLDMIENGALKVV